MPEPEREPREAPRARRAAFARRGLTVALALPLGLLALLCSGCQTTAEKSAKLEKEAKRHTLATEQGLTIARLTLTKMAEGGIYDQIGGGFCRYSVDQYWSIPHF